MFPGWADMGDMGVSTGSAATPWRCLWWSAEALGSPITTHSTVLMVILRGDLE